MAVPTGRRFTKETALAAAQLRRQYARERETHLRLREEKLEALIESIASREVHAGPGFVELCKGRVRGVMERILDRLTVPTIEADDCGAWALALSRLGELERAWDGRPLPGALKPTAKPAARRTSGNYPQPLSAAQVQSPLPAAQVEPAQVEPRSEVQSPPAAPQANPPGLP